MLSSLKLYPPPLFRQASEGIVNRDILLFYCMRTVLLAFGFYTLMGVAMAQAPAEVTNVAAVPGEGFIDLSWDEGIPAGDTVITGYKVYWGTNSVQEVGQSYDRADTVNFTTYTLRDLTPGATYYIAITALCDRDGCESETYSPEIAVTLPEGEEVVAIPPVVLSAQHSEAGKIVITFDQAVQVAEGSAAVLIESRADGSEVGVESTMADGAMLTAMIPEGSLVDGDRYNVVVTSAVQAMDGTAVVPGENDTVRFTARSYTEEVVEEPVEEEPVVEAVEETPMMDSVDAMDLQASLANLAETGEVMLTWVPAEGAVDQVLYIKENDNEWEAGVPLGPEAMRVDVQVAYDASYRMRLTTVNGDAVESDGVEVSFGTPSASAYDAVPTSEDVTPEMPEKQLQQALVATGGSGTVWGFLVVFAIILISAAVSRRKA